DVERLLKGLDRLEQIDSTTTAPPVSLLDVQRACTRVDHDAGALVERRVGRVELRTVAGRAGRLCLLSRDARAMTRERHEVAADRQESEYSKHDERASRALWADVTIHGVAGHRGRVRHWHAGAWRHRRRGPRACADVTDERASLG